MKTHFRFFRRKIGIFYLVETATRRQKTLGTRNRAEVQKLVQAHNDAVNQPLFNLALAGVYMAGSDPKLMSPVYKKKRAITREEHQAILARETKVRTSVFVI